jgi:hypothetical protein
MHTPTKTQWNTVIDNLKKILPVAVKDEQLDMQEHRVQNHYYKCGTVHCVGGWYAVAVFDLMTFPMRDIGGFTEGADQMAMDLGFEDIDDFAPARRSLIEWASEHPWIWGNVQGSAIFTHTSAYDYAKNMTEVVQFLEGVRDRSPD